MLYKLDINLHYSQGPPVFSPTQYTLLIYYTYPTGSTCNVITHSIIKHTHDITKRQMEGQLNEIKIFFHSSLWVGGMLVQVANILTYHNTSLYYFMSVSWHVL